MGSPDDGCGSAGSSVVSSGATGSPASDCDPIPGSAFMVPSNLAYNFAAPDTMGLFDQINGANFQFPFLQ